jgi:hypothetical protein
MMGYGMPARPPYVPAPIVRAPLIVTAGTDPDTDLHMMKLGELTIDLRLQKADTYNVERLKVCLVPPI